MADRCDSGLHRLLFRLSLCPAVAGQFWRRLERGELTVNVAGAFSTCKLGDGFETRFECLAQPGAIVALSDSAGDFENGNRHGLLRVSDQRDRRLFSDGPNPVAGPSFTTTGPELFRDRFDMTD